MSSDVFNHDPSLLGDLEREVLRLVEARSHYGGISCDESSNLGHKESTIRTVLHRLEKKGYLKHSIDNRTYLYCAVKAHREVAAMAVKQSVLDPARCPRSRSNARNHSRNPIPAAIIRDRRTCELKISFAIAIFKVRPPDLHRGSDLGPAGCTQNDARDDSHF